MGLLQRPLGGGLLVRERVEARDGDQAAAFIDGDATDLDAGVLEAGAPGEVCHAGVAVHVELQQEALVEHGVRDGHQVESGRDLVGLEHQVGALVGTTCQQGQEGQQGLARELARMNLPANIYTQWYWKVDLHNLLHFLRLRADAHAQRDEYRLALAPLSQAIREAAEPRESWYQLQLALQFELKDYAACARTLRVLVSRYPLAAAYWKQLSGVLLELRRDSEALAILALAERQGHLEAGDEIRNLAHLFLHLDIPYKAARLLESGLSSGRLDPTADNYAELSRAWQAARETAMAIAALEQASRRSDDGKLALRLAFLYQDQENWPSVITALARARKLGVNEPGRAALLQGIAALELGRHIEAAEAFTLAQTFAATREQATAWQQHARALLAQDES